MRWTPIVVLGCFGALLGAPFLFRPSQPPPPADALQLIIISPHNEQIRTEFARAFDQWHLEHYGRRVRVDWNVPGGTSEIRKMLEAQFEAAFEAGREPGGDADLVFGGGTYEHDKELKAGVMVTINGEQRQEPISAPVDFDNDWLASVYGANDIGGINLYDTDKQWFGTALSGFGIVYNRDVLKRIGVEEPIQWADLCNPKLRGWLALVNPGQSGSITTAFDAILQRRGWERGWQILRRAAANGRYFSGSSLKPPTDVSQGNAAMGVCIDFYGRYQSQAIKEAGDEDRLGYVDPPGASTIDPDPISMLRGAPHPETARRFIEFCLTHEGQSLWQFQVDDPIDDGLGPEQFELRRMPVLRSMYEQHFDRMIDQVNPFELAKPVENPDYDMRSFIAILFAAMAMDNHHQLKEAWEAIVTHPAYPAEPGIVTANDVDDPVLKAMLRKFDAMPMVKGPNGEEYSLATRENRRAVKNGWFKKGWKDAGLWPEQGNPTDVMQSDFNRFFRGNYRRIVRMAGEVAAVAATPATE